MVDVKAVSLVFAEPLPNPLMQRTLNVPESMEGQPRVVPAALILLQGENAERAMGLPYQHSIGIRMLGRQINQNTAKWEIQHILTASVRVETSLGLVPMEIAS